MKKISFLLLAYFIFLTSVSAQQHKNDMTSKTINARSNEKILNKKLRPTKISKPAPKGEGDKMLNPQPLPPKARKDVKQEKRGSEKMRNPQLLPPKAHEGFKPNKRGSKKMLNPQPLPPKESSIKSKS